MCLFITTHIYKRTGAGPTGRKNGCGWAMPCTSGTPGVGGVGGEPYPSPWLPATSFSVCSSPRLKCSFSPTLCATPFRCTGSPSTALKSSSPSIPPTPPGTGRWWRWSPKMTGTTTSPSECVRRRVCETLLDSLVTRLGPWDCRSLGVTSEDSWALWAKLDWNVLKTSFW